MSSNPQVRSVTADTAVSVLPSRAAAVEAVRALLPRIRARARQVDTDRLVPEETIRELTESGLFGVVKPKSLGGSELGFATLVDVAVEVASACGSSGWVYGVLAGHSCLLNLFPIEAQREVFANPHTLTATVFRFNAEVRPVAGGYRLTGGEGRFCSGIDHADWVMIGCNVLLPGGATEQRYFVIPRSDIAEIVDDWYVAGMRGTGSKTIRVPEAFIPEHRSVLAAEMVAGTSPGARYHRGAIYRMNWLDVAPFSLVGVPMGVGRAMVATFAESLKKTMAKFTSEQMAEQSTTFTRLAVAAADIDAAHASVIENALRIDNASEPSDVTPEQLARVHRDWAYAAQRSRNAVTSLFEASGGSATYDQSELQRLWRDANAAAQHIAFAWDNSMPAYGRALVGVARAKFGPKGR